MVLIPCQGPSPGGNRVVSRLPAPAKHLLGQRHVPAADRTTEGGQRLGAETLPLEPACIRRK